MGGHLDVNKQTKKEEASSRSRTQKLEMILNYKQKSLN